VILFKVFAHAGGCEVLACHGRDNALRATELLDEAREAGFLTFVDADWDRVEGKTPTSPNCIWSDHHDLLVDLLCSPALDRVLAERGSAEKIHTFEAEQGKTVLDAILHEAAALGRLRWHNDSGELGLRFAELEIHAYVEGDGLRLRFADVVKVIVQRSGSPLSHDELSLQCDKIAQSKFDARQVASGHDAVAILSQGLRKELGSQRAQDVRVDVLEMELRLAFDWEALKRTVFYSAVRSWEDHNSGWPVLRPE
jgi:hypothetical protein